MSLIFETAKLRVRQFNINDRENFFLLNSHPEVMQFIRPVKNRDECDKFLSDVIAYSTQYPLYGRWFVECKNDNSFAGSFAIIPVENSDTMQLGYALLPEHWGKGYATELTRAGLRYVFTKTSLGAVYGYAEKPNIPSQKVLLKCGFRYNGETVNGGKEITEFVFTKEKYAGSSCDDQRAA